MAERGENLQIFGAVGTQLHAKFFGDNQRDFQNVDRIQAQALPVQSGVGVDILGPHFQIQCLNEQACDLLLQLRVGGRRRLLLERRFVGHIVIFQPFDRDAHRFERHQRKVMIDQNCAIYYAMQAPHPPLKNYYAAEEDRRTWVRDLFNRTAGDYDRLESAMAWGSGPWYRRRALKAAGLGPGMRVVDVGAGTGLVSREAAHIVGDPAYVLGVDPCAGMMRNAKLPAGLQLVLGSAESIPANTASADFLSMGYALRHIGNLSAAFAEFFRVLKPGGQFCLLEITVPARALPRAMLKAYMRVVVPFFAQCLARHRDSAQLMRYYWDTIEACAPPEAIMATLRNCGFVEVSRHIELGIFSEYRGRKRA
jgi:demethylmenaquinone methyltransferase / 2-methoxy-6-polyprenyl-1,4-benzoquinol methylase